jgi:hypothetical protein
MTRLMAVPICNKGDAILIVSVQASAVLMGFVTEATLANFFHRPPQTCECLAFVDRHLPWVEKILERKSRAEANVDPYLACIEIAGADLDNSGIAGRVDHQACAPAPDLT